MPFSPAADWWTRIPRRCAQFAGFRSCSYTHCASKYPTFGRKKIEKYNVQGLGPSQTIIFDFFRKNFLSTPNVKKELHDEYIASVKMLATPVGYFDAQWV